VLAVVDAEEALVSVAVRLADQLPVVGGVKVRLEALVTTPLGNVYEFPLSRTDQE
jgi:hypothetical protein